MKHHPASSPNHPRAWGSLALLPFPLLILANEVEIVTQVAPNGAGYRKLTVAIVADRVADIEQELDRFFPVPDWQGGSRERGDTRVLWRDHRHGGVEHLGDAKLTASGGIFSLHTTYEFTDTIDVQGIQPHEEELAKAKAFKYVLQMPGAITEAPGALTDGARAEWRLKPSAKPQTLTAKSVAFRTWYAIILLYLLGWALCWGLPIILRRRGPRPKRI